MMKRRTDKLGRAGQPRDGHLWVGRVDGKKETEEKRVQEEEENAEENDVKYVVDNFRVK